MLRLGVGATATSPPSCVDPTLLPDLGDLLSQVRFRFTPVDHGPRFEIDDIHVDPHRKG